MILLRPKSLGALGFMLCGFVFFIGSGCASGDDANAVDLRDSWGVDADDLGGGAVPEVADDSVGDSWDVPTQLCADAGACDDEDPCTTDDCVPELGCTHVQNSEACEDGDPCTVDDRCVNGACTPGAFEPCSDNENCTAFSCPLSCNGSEANCLRPFNQVSQVCTHNAYATLDAGFVVPAPNQKHGFTRQLDDGVRCLMLDIHSWLGKLRLCHAACEAGQRDLKKGLQEIAEWLAEHPTEVVSLIVEAHVGEEALFSALADAGLASDGAEPDSKPLLYYHDQPAGAPWPTLLEMIVEEQRLVVFSDIDGANGTWNLDWRKVGWETPFDDDTFTCAPGRGDPLAHDNQVFILNHYTLCPLGACNAAAEENNAFEFLYQRAMDCWEVHPEYNPWGQIPTFINVDNYHLPLEGGFTNRADVFDVVDALNTLWPNSDSPPSP